MQKDPICYVLSTHLLDKYYLTNIYNNRPYLSKNKAFAEIFETLTEAEKAKTICEKWSGFAYKIETIM